MTPPVHLAANAVIGSCLFAAGIVRTPAELGLFISYSVLIDADHILYFASRFAMRPLKETIRQAKHDRSHMVPHLYIFHSPEFNLLLLAGAFVSHAIFLLFVSNMIHILLDIIEHYRYHRNFRWMKKWSIVWSCI